MCIESKVDNHANEIKKTIESFVDSLDGIFSLWPQLMLMVAATINTYQDNLSSFLENECTVIDPNADPRSYSIGPDKMLRFLRLKSKSKKARTGGRTVPIGLAVSLVSQYDSYLGRLLRWIYSIKPEILNASEKQFSYADLQNFSTIEDATEFLVEKEIESILRKSHTDQIEHLEKLLGISLRKNLEVWPSFIEITERRNLFVHCDGVVGTQYLRQCKNIGALIDESVKIGTKLNVRREYFINCYKTLLEFGVKLGQVIWRKLYPDSIVEADKNMNRIAYDLIVSKQYSTAHRLLDFSINCLPKRSSDDLEKTLIINLAQTEKWMGNQINCSLILDKHDWTACNSVYKLAVAVLKDDYENATRYMKKIGANDDDIREEAYYEWPLFAGFRRQACFLEAYQEIFGKPFVIKTMNPNENDRTNPVNQEGSRTEAS